MSCARSWATAPLTIGDENDVPLPRLYHPDVSYITFTLCPSATKSTSGPVFDHTVDEACRIGFDGLSAVTAPTAIILRVSDFGTDHTLSVPATVADRDRLAGQAGLAAALFPVATVKITCLWFWRFAFCFILLYNVRSFPTPKDIFTVNFLVGLASAYA